MARVGESRVGLMTRRPAMEATMLTAHTMADTRPERSESPTTHGWYDPDSVVFQGADDERAPGLLAGEAGRALLDEGGDSLRVIGGRAGDALEPGLVFEGLVERRLLSVR
jgi:hypothetical protein